MAAWFNRKTAQAMAKMAENLKAETLAREEAEEKLKAEIENKAAMERKVKAEAEKMLVAQFNRYTVMVERAEAKAKEETEIARAQVKEAEEKLLVDEAALARAEEKLNESQKQLKAEIIARMQAEEMLRSESDERQRLEARVEEMVSAARAEVEDKVQSSEAELAKVKAKLIEAEELLRTKDVAKVKEGRKTAIEERRKLLEQPVESVYPVGGKRRNVFHLGNIRRKFILIIVLAIFSALTFALSKTKGPAVAEPEDDVIIDTTLKQDVLYGSDIDGGRLNSDATADASVGDREVPASGKTDAPSFNNEGSGNISAKTDDKQSLQIPEAQSLMIKAQPEQLKITASAGGKNNIIQLSDDNRLETRIGSNTYYDFSNVTIPPNAEIRSVILHVEHFEEERFEEGNLEWSIGTGRPGRPTVWAVMKAPVHQGESSEAVDAWDVTSVADTAEKLNSIQLQIKNHNKGAKCSTFVDNAYMVIEYQ